MNGRERAKTMNIALLLSGGTGTRLGSDVPKQYIEAGGKPIISYALETLLNHNQIDAVQIVADLSWQPFILEQMGRMGKTEIMETDEALPVNCRKFRGFSAPGRNRQLSIVNGLADILNYASGSDYVLIHDAARPMLTGKQIGECLDGVKGHDGLTPVLPMKDTVYCSADGKRVTGLLRREEIFAGQAPEVFRLDVYYEANCRLLPEKILTINGSAEPAVMAGLDIVLIPGDEHNVKITTKADLEKFQKIQTVP